MKKEIDVAKTRWEILCGFLMVVALGITLLGSFPFFRPQGTNGPMGGMGDGLFLAIWLFGIFGLSVCFLENAAVKNLLAMLGIGWSILALAWGLVAYRCPANELCLHDTSDNGWLLIICISVFAALLFYEKTKDKIPAVGKFLIKAFARSMVVVWTCALLFSIATFNEPLHLRIDRTAHPISPTPSDSL